MKLITMATAATIAVLPLAVEAETWTLHSHKAWQVKYMDKNSGGRPMCIAGVEHTDGMFLIKVAGGDVWFDLFNDRMDYEPHKGVVNVWVDRGDYVALDAFAEDGGIQMYLNREQGNFILGEIAEGYKVYFDIDGDDYSDLHANLSGSFASMNALLECAEKL